jgi:hypothetical protein
VVLAGQPLVNRDRGIKLRAGGGLTLAIHRANAFAGIDGYACIVMAFMMLWFGYSQNGENHIEDILALLTGTHFVSSGIFALLRLDIGRLSVYLRNLKLKNDLHHTCEDLWKKKKVLLGSRFLTPPYTDANFR